MDPFVWWMLALTLIVIGVVGAFVPGIPGPVLLFAGMLLAAWIDNFSRVGTPTLVILGAFTALAIAAEVLAGMLGARRVGAAPMALVGAAAGTVIGLFFGLVGILIFPFIGAVAGQLISSGGIAAAFRVGVGTWVGLALGALAKAVIVLAMLVTFLISYFRS